MRKRLNGVYRADSGFSGPTRRYVLIVALLVGLASIPTLAPPPAASDELSGDKGHTMDIPFLPPASAGPIQGQRPLPAPSSPAPSPSPSPSASSWWMAVPGTTPSSAAAPSRPRPSASHSAAPS